MKGLTGFIGYVRRIGEFNSWHPLFANASDKSGRRWWASTHFWALVYALISMLPIVTSAAFGRYWWSYVADVVFLACAWAIYEMVFYYSRGAEAPEDAEKHQSRVAVAAASVALAVTVVLIVGLIIVR